MAACSSCGKPIRWVLIVASGKKMPLDPEPAADGTWIPLGTRDRVTHLPSVEYVPVGTDVTAPRELVEFARGKCFRTRPELDAAFAATGVDA